MGQNKKGRIRLLRYDCVHRRQPRDTRKIDDPEAPKGISPYQHPITPNIYLICIGRKRQTATLAKDYSWAITCILTENDSGAEVWKVEETYVGEVYIQHHIVHIASSSSSSIDKLSD